MGSRKRKKLRSGFTTGTAAAAATKAALILLAKGSVPSVVDVLLLTGERMQIKVHSCRRIDAASAVGSVIKDAGDDPDVTNGAEIGSQVVCRLTRTTPMVTISGGTGVGRVTKPGLEIPPGQAAINPGPLKMIRLAIDDVLETCNWTADVAAEIFVPEGETLARKTLNSRLGIVGGISILGTTGIVSPLSHEAYTATVRSALAVAKASGLRRVVLTTGRRSERLAQQKWTAIPAEGFIQIGDYFAQSMQMAADFEFDQVILAVFFGKAVKMAMGTPHTHARSAPMSLMTLSRWALQLSGNGDLAEHIVRANTARQVFDMIKGDYPVLIEKVGMEVVTSATSFGKGKVDVQAVIFGFDGQAYFTSMQGMGYRKVFRQERER